MSFCIFSGPLKFFIPQKLKKLKNKGEIWGFYLMHIYNEILETYLSERLEFKFPDDINLFLPSIIS